MEIEHTDILSGVHFADIKAHICLIISADFYTLTYIAMTDIKMIRRIL